MGEPPVQRVVVLVAMEQEAAPFVREHALKRVKSPPWPAALPLVAFSGMIEARGGMVARNDRFFRALIRCSRIAFLLPTGLLAFSSRLAPLWFPIRN